MHEPFVQILVFTFGGAHTSLLHFSAAGSATNLSAICYVPTGVYPLSTTPPLSVRPVRTVLMQSKLLLIIFTRINMLSIARSSTSHYAWSLLLHLLPLLPTFLHSSPASIFWPGPVFPFFSPFFALCFGLLCFCCSC